MGRTHSKRINYYGKYVAMKSFDNRKIVAASTDPLKAIKKAETQGIKKPVVVFVPKANSIQLY